MNAFHNLTTVFPVKKQRGGCKEKYGVPQKANASI